MPSSLTTKEQADLADGLRRLRQASNDGRNALDTIRQALINLNQRERRLILISLEQAERSCGQLWQLYEALRFLYDIQVGHVGSHFREERGR